MTGSVALKKFSKHASPASDAYEHLVKWLMQLITEKNIPGLMTGLSGTDSILTFLVCADAFQRLGRPERVVGVHFGAPYPPPAKTKDELARLLSFNPSYRWEVRSVLPWLEKQAPATRIIHATSPGYDDDYFRWASLFRMSLNGADQRSPLPDGLNFWVVGTRNATEDALGSYSNISGAVSLQPLIGLWKSDILSICRDLNVPDIALQKSRQVDCDCGRFDIAANHIEEVDAVLKYRAGLIPVNDLENMDKTLYGKISEFIDEQISYARFKKEIPYRPPVDIFNQDRS